MSAAEDHDLLIRLDEKVTSGFAKMEEKMESLLVVKRDHEDRIRSLEIRMWWSNGASSILGGVLGIIFGQVYHNIFK